MNRELALFPLHVVLFPGAFLPLRIFELRYRRLVDECGRDKPFVVVRIREGREAGEPAFTFQTGTCVQFTEMVSQRDGSLGVMVHAQQRVCLHDFRVDSDGLMFAMTEMLPEDDYVPVPQDLQALADALEQQEGESVPDAGMLVWRLAERLPLSLDDKQQLLELDDVNHRLERLRGWLLRHPGWFAA
jgi:Lon protease-like protein